MELEKLPVSILAQIIEISSAAVIAFDDSWKLVHLNPAAERLLGYAGKNTRHLGLGDLFPGDEGPNPITDSDRRDASGVPAAGMSGIMEGRHSSGAMVKLLVTGQHFNGPDGKLHVAVCHDLETLCKGIAGDVEIPAQAAAPSRPPILATGNWSWDIKSGDMQWSASIYRLFGMDPAAFKPTIDWLISRVVETDRTAVEAALQDSLHTFKPVDLAFAVTRTDGEALMISIQADLSLDMNAKPVRMDGTLKRLYRIPQGTNYRGQDILPSDSYSDFPQPSSAFSKKLYDLRS